MFESEEIKENKQNKNKEFKLWSHGDYGPV
jgi:hypothetical protein